MMEKRPELKTLSQLEAAQNRMGLRRIELHGTDLQSQARLEISSTPLSVQEGCTLSDKSLYPLHPPYTYPPLTSTAFIHPHTLTHILLQPPHTLHRN